MIKLITHNYMTRRRWEGFQGEPTVLRWDIYYNHLCDLYHFNERCPLTAFKLP